MMDRKTLALVLISTGFAALPLGAHAAPPRTDWREVVAPDEAELLSALPAEFNAMQKRVAAAGEDGPQRGLHNKSHLALRGSLKVLDGLPEAYRQGFFAKAATYATWVRFSNGQGQRQEDRRPDMRGMAVKILDVPGDNFMPEKSFDLVCNNFAAQPARDIKQFMAFIRAQKNVLTLPCVLAANIGIGESARILSWAAHNLGSRVTSLATTPFFTGLPLQFGPYACHVRLKPNNGPAPEAANTSNPEYLRDDLVSRMATTGLRWDVEVQLYVDAQKTPIEDASVVWDERDAPYVKVAELTLDRRDMGGTQVAADEATGNRLAWNPWNAPKEHRPLGQLMRARRLVYPASARERGATQPVKP